MTICRSQSFRAAFLAVQSITVPATDLAREPLVAESVLAASGRRLSRGTDDLYAVPLRAARGEVLPVR